MPVVQRRIRDPYLAADLFDLGAELHSLERKRYLIFGELAFLDDTTSFSDSEDCAGFFYIRSVQFSGVASHLRFAPIKKLLATDLDKNA